MTKHLKGECRACGAQFEFAAEAVGTIADCPHCGAPTELMLAPPPWQPAVPIKTVVYAVIAVLILIGGLVASIIALKRAERMRSRNPPPTTATTPMEGK